MLTNHGTNREHLLLRYQLMN